MNQTIVLSNKYFNESIAPELKTELKIANIMAVPKLDKIVINCSLGEALKDKKVIESMAKQLSMITGQKVKENKARKAISTFKLREGDVIGLKVTLRGKRMYEFLTKLIAVALPRVRDFRGIPLSGFDGKGNYTFGISEQIIFPELEYRLVDKIRGFEVTFVSTAQNDTAGLTLLKKLGLPFEKEGNK